MENFATTLSQLPPITHIEQITLVDETGKQIAVIENRPGKSGSLSVYHKLYCDFGEISPEAAKLGLQLFAEHTQDAEQNPGKHPNIDRLFELIEHNQTLSVSITNQSEQGEMI